MNTFETGNREEAIRVKFTLKECLFGNSAFYRRVSRIVIPMIIQNTLTNIVGLLDNVMVGQLGTVPMSAVAIVNQLLFIFYLCIFGALAGAGIFGTQFFGKGDMDGVRYAVRYKLLIAITIIIVAFSIFLNFGPDLISLYIAKDTAEADAAATIAFAHSYLNIMLVGLIPFSLTQVYASTMRESGRTTLPMLAGMIAMVVNFVFNGLLIFGLLGFPKLGVVGAALATVISRFTEFLIVVVGAHKKDGKYGFFNGVYSSMRIPKELIWPILSKSLPLLINEFLWSLATASLLQAYSVRGISVIAAMNISGTISQIFNEIFLSLGTSTGIIVGQELGADRLVSARRIAWQMASLSTMCTIIMGALLAIAAPFIPNVYNTEPEIRMLATRCIWVQAICMPINSYANVAYFTLRSGGKTAVTFLFDSCFSWCVSVPAAYILTRFTSLPALNVFTIVSLLEIIKCIIGFCLVKSGIWVRNIVRIKV